MERFKDENKWLSSFGDVINVKCPNCNLKASVRRNFESKWYYNDTRVLECKNCYYSQKGNKVRYIAYVDTYCCNNEDKIKFQSQLLNEKPEKIKLKCPICKESKEFKPKIIEVPFTRNTTNKVCTEKWFDAELWYQTGIGTNVFWAYNEEHILYMEKYILADLRERNASGSYSSTLVARLPKFVKEAKNREKLLKIIQRWKK